MWKQSVLITCLSVINFADAVPPSFITRCKGDDSKCILESAKAAIPTFAAGLPEYNVQSIDPLKLKSVNASQGNLLFVLSDVTVVGLKNCQITRAERDLSKSKLHLSFLCSGKLDGQYELKGNILILPIEGNGGIHCDLNSAEVNIEANMHEIVGADGKTYWQIKTWTHNFVLKAKSNVVFENLYNGNEVLGRAARELIAQNGNDVIMEIGPNVIKAITRKILKYINNFLDKVPYEDLTL